MWKSIQSGFSNVFGVDVRSLALYRIVVSCVILVDLATRAPYIDAFYTDEGSFSRQLCETAMPGGFWSLHLLSGEAWFQILMFGIAATAAVSMMLGYRTRVATIVTWLLLISLHVRNPLILNAGDTILRTVLFWSMFLPLGKVWSIDAWRLAKRARSGKSASPERDATWWVSGASVGIILQLLIMYWFTGIAKFNPEWINGQSLEYVLRMDMFIRPTGKWLLEFPGLLNLMTRGTLWLELIGPTLLLLPWMNRYLRLVMILLFFSLHIGIFLTISVGLFSAISMTCWLPLIPSNFWDNRLTQKLLGRRSAVSETNSTGEPLIHYGSWSMALVSSFLIVYSFAWNIDNLEQLSRSEIPGIRQTYQGVHYVMQKPLRGEMNAENPYCLAFIGRATMLAQEYEMFGPVPRLNHWFVYKARLEDGSSINLLDGRPPSDERPERMMLTLPDHRWRKLHRNLMHPSFVPFREPLAEYFARKWNREHGPEEQIVRMDFISYVEEISPNMRLGDYEEVILATLRFREEEEANNFVDLLEELEAGGDFLPY